MDEKKRILDNVATVRKSYLLDIITAEEKDSYLRRLYKQYEKAKVADARKKVNAYA